MEFVYLFIKSAEELKKEMFKNTLTIYLFFIIRLLGIANVGNKKNREREREIIYFKFIPVPEGNVCCRYFGSDCQGRRRCAT